MVIDTINKHVAADEANLIDATRCNAASLRFGPERSIAMRTLLELLGERRKQILHYILVGLTFLVCYFVFGYLNLTGGYGGGYGYGCYDFAPFEPAQEPTLAPVGKPTPTPHAQQQKQVDQTTDPPRSTSQAPCNMPDQKRESLT